mgnify:CR=1 FL=1
MNILLKIVWKLLKDVIKFIVVLIGFAYVFSAFGAMFALSALAAILGSPTGSVESIISITLFTLIIASWVFFIAKWFKVRIKEERSKL